MRQIVLDTETTGLDPADGHRIIEIGCVELLDRRLSGNNYHQYIQPNRVIDEGAIEVHGITNEFLQDKPKFSDIAAEFLEYIKGAELIIHNVPFDVGFMNAEFKQLTPPLEPVSQYCQILDTLVLARKMHPGQRNSLDALCKRYGVDNAHRDLHGALLDAEILADVYVVMTGGQVSFLFNNQQAKEDARVLRNSKLKTQRPALKVIAANEQELHAHEARLDSIEKANKGFTVWRDKQELPAE